MRIELCDGHTIVCAHIYPVSEIAVGSRWLSSSNNIVTVTKIVDDEVHYSGALQVAHSKDSFSFQCRYCLILDPEAAKATGWSDGLCQDYNTGLGRWFANRPGARQQLRETFKETT